MSVIAYHGFSDWICYCFSSSNMQLTLWLILQWGHKCTHSVLRCARKIQCLYSIKWLVSLFTSLQGVASRDIVTLTET